MSPIPPRGPFQRCRFPRVSGDEPSTFRSTFTMRKFFPRVSGDEPPAPAPKKEEKKFSPRERG